VLYYSIVCSECETADQLFTNDMSREEAKNHFEAKGWKIGKRKAVCPECEDAKKKKKKRVA